VEGSRDLSKGSFQLPPAAWRVGRRSQRDGHPGLEHRVQGKPRCCIEREGPARPAEPLCAPPSRGQALRDCCWQARRSTDRRRSARAQEGRQGSRDCRQEGSRPSSSRGAETEGAGRRPESARSPLSREPRNGNSNRKRARLPQLPRSPTKVGAMRRLETAARVAMAPLVAAGAGVVVTMAGLRGERERGQLLASDAPVSAGVGCTPLRQRS
jgi:hypothetical protein